MENIATLTSTIQKRWGARPGQKFYTAPKWSRFRMFVQYEHGNAKYPSFDYCYSFKNGIKIKNKSEATGLAKLLEYAHKLTKQGKKYRYINIFANLSNELDTISGDFNYLVCTIVNGQITYKHPLFWRADNHEMIDTKKSLEYQQTKLN